MTYSGTNMWVINLWTSLRADSKIDSFRTLPVGWHYGSGGPISEIVITKAKEMLYFFLKNGFTFNDAFPGVDGEIQLTAYHADHYISVIIETDLSASFIHEKSDVDMVTPIEGENLDQIKDEVTRATGKIWNILDTSTRSIMIRTANASPSWDLKSHQQTARPRLSVGNV